MLGHVRMHSENKAFKKVLLIEMLSRTINKMIQELLRNKMIELAHPGDVNIC